MSYASIQYFYAFNVNDRENCTVCTVHELNYYILICQRIVINSISAKE